MLAPYHAAGDLARGLVAKGYWKIGVVARTRSLRLVVNVWHISKTNEIELLCQARDNSPVAIGPFAEVLRIHPSRALDVLEGKTRG